MLKSVEGIFRNGRVELLESPIGVDEARVVVTFLPGNAPVYLVAHGIDATRAGDLRSRLLSFAQDWERPEMNVYDEL
jgi:hypothetical protein